MRVAITGIGMVNALGNTSLTVWNNLLLKTIGISHHDLAGPIKIGARPVFSKSPWHCKLPVPSKQHTRSLSTYYALSAATEALLQSSVPREGLHLLLDTCISPTLPHTFPNVLSTELACSLGLVSHTDTKISAIGSLDSFCSAVSRVQSGSCKSVILVGAQASLTPYFLEKLGAIGLLNSKDNGNPLESVRSFDINAKGLVLGEGAAAVVVEEWEAAVSRGARVLAEVRAYSRNNFGKYLLRAEESGRGLELACRNAVEKAGGRPEYVIADGCSLADRDFAELSGLAKAFGKARISGIKANVGHLMGALGATQVATAVLAVEKVRHR